MPTDDDSSDLSSLSSLSPVPSDVELDEASGLEPSRHSGILKFFSKVSEEPPKEPSPPPRKRSPSPPHEYVLADNPDIAFIVMFRSRFHDAFPKSLPHFGPQEIERDVVEPIPGDRVEHLLCALLGLLLNRKQDVKMGHYGRALEDAVASHKSQWPSAWEEKNPLSGGATFNSMSPSERLTLLRTLIWWSMSSSDTVKALINQSYKQNRHEDDLNQPKSVQPWGSDGDKRRYFLIEGQDDTAFRVYRESNPAGTNRTWRSVAGTIEELKALADKLDSKDGGPKAKKLGYRMLQAIPRFEAGEEKRRRREYRQIRKEQFKRPEPGYSLYEGRTRGKRVKYTYSDDEDGFYSDSTGNRRSSRNTGANTPAEPGPLITSSGRTVRAPPRLDVTTGENTSDYTREDNSQLDHENSLGPNGRPRRSAAMAHGTNGWSATESRAQMAGSSNTEESASDGEFGDDEEEADAHLPEESEEDDDFPEEALEEDDMYDEPRTLVVKLAVTPPKLRTALAPSDQASKSLPITDLGEGMKIISPHVPLPVSPLTDKLPRESIMEATEKLGGSWEIPGVAGEQSPSAHVSSVVEAPEAVNMSPVPTTSLAFRGSPEKPSPQQLPQANCT